jgi:hypothetical protein
MYSESEGTRLENTSTLYWSTTSYSYSIHIGFEQVSLLANPSKLFIPMVSGFENLAWRGEVKIEGWSKYEVNPQDPEP